MPDTVLGLPLHVLVLHAVVVLVPLAAVGSVAIALVPPWRARYGGLAALLAVGSVAVVPIAVTSGERLAERMRAAQLLPVEGFRHGELGGQTLYWTLPLAVLTVALVFADARRRRRRPLPRPTLPALAVLVVVAAVAAAVHVARVGHLGAQSVWQGRVPAATAPR